MNKHLRLGGMILALGSLVACAAPPQQRMSGSQPVYSGNTYPAPANGTYNNGGYNNGGYNNNTANNGNYNNGNQYASQTWGTVTRVDNLGSKQDTGAGAVIGGVVGAIAGNQIGRTMNDAKTTGTVVGAVGGGLLGNAIERNQNRNNTVLRVYVRMDGGGERYWDVTQAQITPSVGQRVRIENDQLFTS